MFAALFVVAAGAALHAQGIAATLPNGREIHPAGRWIRVAPYPFAIALRPDGAQVAIPSIGFPFALNIVSKPDAASPDVRTLPEAASERKDVATHAGLVYSLDGSQLYVATGESGRIAIYNTTTWKKTSTIELDGITVGRNYKRSFAATAVLSASGRWLYALDQGNWRVVLIDLESRERVASIPTGAYPYGIALSPDDAYLYVTNSGLFEYSPITRVKGAPGHPGPPTAGTRFPASGYPSKLARKGAILDGQQVPPLGDENSARGSSLWTYKLTGGVAPQIVAKLRLGTPIAEKRNATIGGAAPTGVVADHDAVYVSLSHEDSVAKVSRDGAHLLKEAPLTPFSFTDAHGRPLRGVMPSGLAFHRDQLYVAEAGINAVAVLNCQTMQVIEHIPAGWNPSAVATSNDGRTLYVVNTKGRGTGPNGGPAHQDQQPSYIGSLEYGSLGVVDLDKLGPASELTATVVAANLAASATRATLPHLKHCFLIIRENRTYDEVLGDLAQTNGDPALARFGMKGWAEEGGPTATGLQVTPNLHALVQQFATSDNFYVDSDVSADGHRWIVGINPTPFFNTAWTSNYGGRRTSSVTAEEPGRRALFGGADGPMPEDEPQFGSLWEHVAGAGRKILNYGEGLEVEGSDEEDGLAPEGQRLLLNSPVPLPIFESSDRHFPTFNLGIPDQVRAAEFERDFSQRLAHGSLPALIVIRLPNDHTADIRPLDGYPYRASYVADNDLALGKIVAFLSHSSAWKDSAVFITEDDAQGGVDHVDAHRSILAIASPWVRQGAIAHSHSSMGSITRTINQLLGLGSLNLEDALAGDLLGVFDSTPHLEPFTVRPSDPRVFDSAKARLARPKTKAEAAALRDMDDPEVIRPQIEAAARRRLKTAPHRD